MGAVCSKDGCGRKLCCQDSHQKGEFGENPYGYDQSQADESSDTKKRGNLYPTGESLNDLMKNVTASIENVDGNENGTQDRNPYGQSRKKNRFQSDSNYKKSNFNGDEVQQQRKSGYFNNENLVNDDSQKNHMQNSTSHNHPLIESNYRNKSKQPGSYNSLGSSSGQLAQGHTSSTKIKNYSSGEAIYKGPRKGNMKDGEGVQTWPDGSTYKGTWVDDKTCGRGKFTFANGDVYQGQFANDMASGRGVFITRQGKFQGTWWDDLQHGNGSQQWAGGSKYEGNYNKGRKSGYGRYVWADKSEYTGDWHNNTITGIGRVVWADGRMYDGEWKNNIKHGKGKHTWPDGRRYEGGYRNDKRQGYGKFTLPDGSVYSGQWQNNLRHGKGMEKYPDNTTRQGIWQQGKLKEWIN